MSSAKVMTWRETATGWECLTPEGSVFAVVEPSRKARRWCWRCAPLNWPSPEDYPTPGKARTACSRFLHAHGVTFETKKEAFA